MSKLVIAEKPMLARDIARAITGKEVSESARLPISGNGYTVCACAGHLLELVEPDAIDPKWGMPWSLDVLPIEVHDWPKEPAVDKKTGESKKPLIDQIAGLLKTCDSVIAAGDPDDEGQLIVDELLDYLGYAGKVERVYVNDNIEKNIVKAFDKLVPNDSCRGAGNAAYARQMADMCFGVNETRLATKRLDGLFTVGRVQTPTLGLVVKRDEAIAHHVTRKFYELFASGDSDAGELTFKYLPGKELLAGKARKHLRSGKDALEKKDSLGALSEKKYRTEKLDKKAAQKRMQFSKYFHRNVYENAATQAGKKKALTILSGGIKGMLSSLAGAVSQFFPLIIAFILAFGLISVVGGGAADEEQKSASLDGMPAWVTYDLVLACLNAHEQYGYPASALLGQMMIENGTSDSGSDLGRLYHNYGGVKYAGYDYGGLITGSVKMLTTEYSASGSAYKTYADFAVFKDDDSYMKYRCEHLYKQSNYTRVPNYQKAIDTNNSELFLRALQR